MENIEVMNNEVVVEEAVETAVNVPKISVKKAVGIGVVVFAIGYVVYKKVIKPAVDKKKAAAENND